MGNNRSRLSLALAGALALTAATAFAGEITLYQRSGFQGRSMTAVDAVPNLDRSAFNDSANSIIVGDGTWEACTEPNFRGRCAQLAPGNYGKMTNNIGLIASVRQIGYTPGPARVVIEADPPVTVSSAPAYVNPGPPRVVEAPIVESARLPAGPRIVLYQHTSRGIRAVDVTADVADLNTRQFDNTADAAFVTGGVWRLCSGKFGRGECADYSPGQYPTLGSLDRRVGSAYLISAAPDRYSTVTPIASGRVVLFQFQNFGGPSVVVENGRAPDLDWANFRYPAASMRVESGTWLMCPDIGYQGQCQVFDPGEYPVLGTPLERGIVSARQVWRLSTARGRCGVPSTARSRRIASGNSIR